MNIENDKIIGRRELLAGFARGGVLAGLAALAAWLGIRTARSGDNENCDNSGICRGCARADDCGLPAALTYRQAVKET